MAVTALSRTLMTSCRVFLQTPHSCVSLPAPTQCFNLSLISFPRHPHSVPKLWSKGRMCLQVNPAPRVRSARTYCQTITSYRTIRKNLLQSIHRALRRAHGPKSKPGIWTWCGTPLCMAFLAPPATQEAQKEVPQLPVQPVVKPKKKGWLLQLFVSLYEFLNLCLRALRLAVTFTPILMLYPVTYLGSTATDAWWALMLAAIEVSGPILIKLGQWASTRRDLFPESCCSQFSRLQRRIKPHSWRFTVYRMKRAFGPNWRKIFVKFDNDGNPIGSGCVAQVYKVWMSSEAIADEEILEEILADMDDETVVEGMEVMGDRLFGLGLHLLGLGSKTNPDNPQALSDYLRQKEEKRNMERERQRLLEEAEKAAQATQEPQTSEEAGQEPQSSGHESDTPSEEAHIAEWQEAELDKSLPMCDAPPEDLEGLVPVAVKVMHPGMEQAFRRDLTILRTCASIVTALVPPLRWLSLPQCVDEFAQVMSAQINLKVEADNLEKFSENFSDVPFIKFPRPLRPYVTTKVLVETFEEGEAMLDVLRSPEEGDADQLKKRLAEIGVDALLKMVFVDNLVHGDLHPGNMVVQNITSGAATGDQMRVMMVDIGCDTFVMDVQPDPNPLRICFLDCGITSKLSKQNLVNIRSVFKQVVLGDGESVAELFLEHSEHQCADPQAFREEVDSLVQAARESTVSLSQVDVGVLLQQVLGVLLKHKVRLESAFSAVVLAIFVLEGLGRALDPNMDILERARPILVTNAMS